MGDVYLHGWLTRSQNEWIDKYIPNAWIIDIFSHVDNTVSLKTLPGWEPK